MDRGAARSRKRAQTLAKLIERPLKQQPRSNGPGSKSESPGEHRQKSWSHHDPYPKLGQPSRLKRRDELPESIRYRPKALRESAALIYASKAFPLPPSPEVLDGVTRIDLEGSRVTDVSWLRGTKVTWLSLAGCAVTEGWDAVGLLADLSGAIEEASRGMTLMRQS